MEWALFWIGVNFLIGYAIGKPKGQAAGSTLLCVLLGPIGWIIAALSRGHTRTCPFCAESVRSEATVCKHCHKELSPELYAAGSHAPSRARNLIMSAVLIVLIGVAVFVWLNPWTGPKESQSQAPPASLAPTLAGPPIGSYVSIKRATRVSVPYGEAVIPAGGRVKLLSAQGSTVTIDYGGHSVPIPADSVSR